MSQSNWPITGSLTLDRNQPLNFRFDMTTENVYLVDWMGDAHVNLPVDSVELDWGVTRECCADRPFGGSWCVPCEYGSVTSQGDWSWHGCDGATMHILCLPVSIASLAQQVIGNGALSDSIPPASVPFSCLGCFFLYPHLRATFWTSAMATLQNDFAAKAPRLLSPSRACST